MKTKFAISPKAVRILRKVQKHFLEEPRRLDMGIWGRHLSPREKKNRAEIWPEFAESEPPCGTVACIAGTVKLLVSPPKRWKNFFEDADRFAADALELTLNQQNALFDSYAWPPNFRARYQNSRIPETRAQVTCERIDHFIATGE